MEEILHRSTAGTMQFHQAISTASGQESISETRLNSKNVDATTAHQQSPIHRQVSWPASQSVASAGGTQQQQQQQQHQKQPAMANNCNCRTSHNLTVIRMPFAQACSRGNYRVQKLRSTSRRRSSFASQCKVPTSVTLPTTGR